MNKPITHLLLLSLFLMGCDRSGDPRVQGDRFGMVCSMISAIACTPANANKNAYIGLLKDMQVNCPVHLNGLDVSFFTPAFDYSTVTKVQYIHNVLSAEFDNWVNDMSMPQYSLPAQPMRVCGFIDINGNGEVDIAEPYLDQIVDFAQPQLPFSAWSDY